MAIYSPYFEDHINKFCFKALSRLKLENKQSLIKIYIHDFCLNPLRTKTNFFFSKFKILLMVSYMLLKSLLAKNFHPGSFKQGRRISILRSLVKIWSQS